MTRRRRLLGDAPGRLLAERDATAGRLLDERDATAGRLLDATAGRLLAERDATAGRLLAERECRVMFTRRCPAGGCSGRPCARFEDDDESRWHDEPWWPRG